MVLCSTNPTEQEMFLASQWLHWEDGEFKYTAFKQDPNLQIIENVYLQSPVPHPPEPLIDLVEQGDNWACFIPRSNTDVETFKKRNL